MGSERIPKMILKCNFEGSKRKRNPREQWMDGIRKVMFSQKDAEDK